MFPDRRLSSTDVGPHKKDLAGLFCEYFEIIHATTPALKNEVYAIRYQVYCEDLGYESKTAYPDGLEFDVYDDHAEHYLLLHKNSKRYVGCMRFIRKQAGKNLPFEQLVPNLSVDKPADYAEISRLAILPDFRRRMNDGLYGESGYHYSEEERRLFPHISLGLILIGPALMLAGQSEASYAVMEPRLCRLLQRFGLYFTRVSDFFEHKGTRAVYALSLETVKSGPASVVADMLNYIRAQLTPPTRLRLVHKGTVPLMPREQRPQRSNPACLYSIPSNV